MGHGQHGHRPRRSGRSARQYGVDEGQGLAVLIEQFGRGRGGGRLAPVIGGDPAGLGLIAHQKCAAPQAGRLGFHQPQHRLDGDRRIHRRAAPAQHLHPGLDRQRVGGGDERPARDRRGPGRVRPRLQRRRRGRGLASGQKRRDGNRRDQQGHETTTQKQHSGGPTGGEVRATRPARGPRRSTPLQKLHSPACVHPVQRLKTRPRRKADAPVAQLDRAPDYESGGQEFESLRVRHFPFVWRSAVDRLLGA